MKTLQTCWYCAENRRYLKQMYHWHRAAAAELKKSPNYQTGAKRLRQLLIWSRLLEDCGMLWKWILQTSSYLEGVCVSHQPTCFCLLLGRGGGGGGFAQQLWWDRKKELPLPRCGLLLEARRIWKVRNRDVQESPRVSLPGGTEHLCTGWEGTSASESTWIAEDKCSGMAGKLPCLQLFPPFVYLFFFTVLNITSLSLLLEGKYFQCLCLHFRLSKEILRGKKKVCPQSVGTWAGLAGFGRRGSSFTHGTYLWCSAGCVWQHPGSASMGGCRQAWASTAWLLLWAPHWAPAMPCVPAPQPICLAAPWEVWLSSTALPPPSQPSTEG